MVKRARLIYNPTAGREQIRKSLPNILERLEKAGYETSTHATTGKDCAKRAAKAACERKFDLVIAAGGDGTLNEVISGIAEQPYRPTLGLIPGGTTNDFARALHIPKDIKEACEVICTGRKKSIDIGKVGDSKYFINIAAAGTLTELTYEVPIKLKTMLGHAAYYIKGIEKLPGIRPSDVVIEYDGNSFEGEIMLFLVANTNSVGGFEKLAPNAYINDGKFDLLILKKTNLADVVRLVAAALRGDHLSDERVIYVQAKNIKIHMKNPLSLNVDGEYGGELTGEITNLHNHIEMIVPNKEIPCIQDLTN